MGSETGICHASGMRWALGAGIGVLLLFQTGVGHAENEETPGHKAMFEWLAKKQAAFAAKVAEVLSDLPSGRLYSIDPTLVPKELRKDNENRIGGFLILGSVDLDSMEQRKLIYNSLVKSIADGRDTALCFEPHHALRVFKEGKTYDFIICFSCAQLVGSMGESALDPSGRKVFDDLLDAHKIPRDKSLEEIAEEKSPK
jgi:hypothetical protein